MKRILALTLVVVVLAALGLPGVAFAGNGNGKASGKATAPGQLKKAPTVQDAAEAPVEDDTAQANGKANGKPDWAGSADGDGVPNEDGSGRQAKRGSESTASAETSGTTIRTRDRAGIANAADRIDTNITKAQAKVADGTMKRVPPGLLKVLAKFLSWLGIDTDTGETPAVTDPGSVEETGTPAPSVDDTSAPQPDPSVEQTSVTP